MKFLHTADLHIGKTLNDVSLLDDQAYVLEQIVQYASQENVDGVLISGDVYQKSAPSAEAMTLFNTFVSHLVALKKQVFVISGNHDSDRRIAYFSDLLKLSGVHISPMFDGHITRVEMNDGYGKLWVHLLPFVKPIQVAMAYHEEKITGYQDALRAVIRNNPVDETCRNVLLCHQFITGAERSDSEDVTVGGLDNIDDCVFDSYDYVALGHIHKPQKVRRETLRYAGSPIKYSFSEVNHKKSVCLVEMEEKGRVNVRTLPLLPRHEMRTAEGYLNDLLASEYSQDYMSVTVHDENPIPDAKLILISNVFPNLMRYNVENSKNKLSDDVLVGEPTENKSVEELFRDFYRFQRNNAEPAHEQMALIEEIYSKLREDEE